jgi:hypothetical protein
MTLTVEDGTGLSNADAFISLAYADAYHTNLGNTAWTGADALKEAAIRRASLYLTDSFKWQGYKINGRDQALGWPRYYVGDDDGFAVPSDEVPSEIERATAEIALLELVSPGTMNPTSTPSAKVKRQQVGPLSVEYENYRTDAWADRPVPTKVMDIIGPLLNVGKTGNRLVGEGFRS